MWIETYSKCGCSIGPVKKSELLGYCALHGNNWITRIRVKRNKLLKFPSEIIRNKK